MIDRDRAHQVLDALLDSVQPGKGADVPYYTQHDSPLGKRAHLDAVKRGRLKGWKVGRLVYARRDDVHQFIEEHPVQPKKAAQLGPKPQDSARDWLTQRGVI